MKSSLATYHDLRSIGVVRAYVVETGRFFGADATELKELELAAEEAAGFIIEALRPDREEPFEIEANRLKAVCVSVSATGVSRLTRRTCRFTTAGILQHSWTVCLFFCSRT